MKGEESRMALKHWNQATEGTQFYYLRKDKTERRASVDKDWREF